jgi:hypothetical protein
LFDTFQELLLTEWTLCHQHHKESPSKRRKVGIIIRRRVWKEPLCIIVLRRACGILGEGSVK